LKQKKKKKKKKKQKKKKKKKKNLALRALPCRFGTFFLREGTARAARAARAGLVRRVPDSRGKGATVWVEMQILRARYLWAFTTWPKCPTFLPDSTS